tara:strand:- start:232 stop:795 length:564 start_codon:yes stop_codon:yes gene_type:complete
MNFLYNKSRQKRQSITYKNVKNEMIEQQKTQHNKTATKRSSFHIANYYIPSIKKAYKIKSRKTLETILERWDDAINKQIEWGEETGVANEKEIYQIKRINLREIIKIINLAPITREIKLNAEVGFVFAMGIVFATFIFETTSMCLTIREIYDTIPIKYRKTITLSKFKSLFMIKGTSEKINKILYNK